MVNLGNGFCREPRGIAFDFYSLVLLQNEIDLTLFFLIQNFVSSIQICSVHLFIHVWFFVTPWTAVRQASLFITNSWSLLKLISIESVMPSNHLILCRPLLLPSSIFPSIRVFSNESALPIRWPKYWSFSFLYSPTLTCIHDYWKNHSPDWTDLCWQSNVSAF